MIFYIVICPCCPPENYLIFSDKELAFNHAHNREEYGQKVYEIDIDKGIIMEVKNNG